MIQVIYLINNIVLISHIEELSVGIGEPDCKLTNPFLIKVDKLTNGIILLPWMMEYITQSVLKISSDKILTIADPSEYLLNKYKELTSK